MNKKYLEQFSNLLRKVESQRRLKSSNEFRFVFPDDLKEVELKSPVELESFSEYVNTYFADYGVSSAIDVDEVVGLHEVEQVLTIFIFRLSDRDRYEQLLKKTGVTFQPSIYRKNPTFKLSNGLVVDTEKNLLTYGDKYQKVGMTTQSGKLIQLLLSNTSGKPLTPNEIHKEVQGYEVDYPGTPVYQFVKNLRIILRKNLCIPKKEVDQIVHIRRDKGYINLLQVELV